MEDEGDFIPLEYQEEYQKSLDIVAKKMADTIDAFIIEEVIKNAKKHR